jgi:hypothetical protein
MRLAARRTVLEAPVEDALRFQHCVRKRHADNARVGSAQGVLDVRLHGRSHPRKRSVPDRLAANGRSRMAAVGQILLAADTASSGPARTSLARSGSESWAAGDSGAVGRRFSAL